MRQGAERSRDLAQVRWIGETLEAMKARLPLAHRLGVPVLAGTDWFPMVTLADELAMMRELGLDARAALGAATTAARRFLGEPGLDERAPADLVLYREDPRADLRRVTAPELVMLRGRVVRGAAGA